MRTFVRLLGFLSPYRRSVGLSAGLAAVAMRATVAIPALIGRASDSIRSGRAHGLHHQLAARAHDRHQLVLAGIAVAIAGVLRLALTVSRRMVAGRVSLGVEYDLRNRMYGH